MVNTARQARTAEREHLRFATMVHVLAYTISFLLFLHGCSISCLCFSHKNIIDHKVLNVGEELYQEKLPLQMGSRLYQLKGLKPSMWYEVKISYPASIPASFSILLKRHDDVKGLNVKRRLLNTEKLIFKADSPDILSLQNGLHVLVIVEPAGVVAISHGLEREFIVFNIVCDELLVGIPHKAWWVGMLVFLCLGLALIIPYFLPSYLLENSQSSRTECVGKNNGFWSLELHKILCLFI
ncbi:PREDICTED: uncharacterized protein LOC104589112 isoform X2 [Nelumbo nucifera]|uniref:Uncharacterized protein LOC104589112 isoform X2 n=1 Tax=Nelumbo nucifera TaxID=4432 RepID=A0A1U7YYF9_NELNU|nr:PREDICTED: uncharacterized protein LOC104589112 isoform X2 [Nelumbo nucifera]